MNETKRILILLKDAESLLKDVLSSLAKAEQLARDESDWGMIGSINSFQKTIEDVLSHDSNEAGLEPFIETISKKVKS